MIKPLTNNYLLVFVIGMTAFSCSTEIAKPIPDRHPEMSQGRHDKYLDLLKNAYKEEDYFSAAIQLANLKANKSDTYNLLKYAVNQDPYKCEKVYEWYWYYDRYDFGVNILKHDTIKFKEVIRLCENLKATGTYQQYAERKDIEEKEIEKNRVKEDTTHFNMELVAELKKIYDADQGIRHKYSDKIKDPALKEKLRTEMQIIDSLNLIKIDSIFDLYGYPSKELVGRDGNFTPALVIHHSNSLEARYKYLPFLEQAVKDSLLSKNTLNMIKRRIEDMELDLKNQKPTKG